MQYNYAWRVTWRFEYLNNFPSTVVFVTAERYTKLIAISTIVHNLEDHAKNMRLSCIDDSTLNIWRGFKNRSHDKKVFLILQVSSYSRMQNNRLTFFFPFAVCFLTELKLL